MPDISWGEVDRQTPDNSLSKARWQTRRKNERDVLKASFMTLEAGLVIPSLMLIYAGIDAMASLDMPKGQCRVTGKDFQKWVRKYLIPEMRVPCEAIDLYAARCGLLHTLSSTSDLAKAGKARQLGYFGDVETARLANELAPEDSRDDWCAVSQVDLLLALERGILKFELHIRSDSEKLAVADERTVSIYDDIETIAEIAKSEGFDFGIEM